MPDIRTVDLTVCPCCVMAALNGDTSGHDYYCPDSPEPLSVIAGLYDVVSVAGDDTEDGAMDAYFSHQSCDGCGDRLAGDRFDVTALVR